MINLKLGRILTTTLLCVAPFFSANAQDLASQNVQKSRIIEYLIRTVQWPKESIHQGEFELCLLGTFDDLAPYERLDNLVVNNMKIKLKKFPNAQNKSQFCDLIYISKSDKDKEDLVKKLFQGKSTLLISDSEHFARDGGSINFINVGERVAITVNLESMKTSHLSFDLKGYDQVTVIPTKEDLKNVK